MIYRGSRVVGICACVALVISFATALSGCSKKEKAATQVVAKVDGEEISVHQVNGVLSKVGKIGPEELPKVRADVLDGLIDQQLAVNLAISKKLDRSAEVVAAIDNAKREILAKAAMDQVLADVTKPSDDEAKKYYLQNPALFSQRRVFSLQEIALRKTSPNVSGIRDRVQSAKSLPEIATWLKSQSIDFSVNEGIRAAEQIPLEVLPALQSYRDGQLGFIEASDAYLIMRMVSSRSSPVSESQAIPRIKQFLFNQKASSVAKAARADLRTKAKIEYLGEFSGGAQAYREKAEAELKAAKRVQEQARLSAEQEAATLAQQRAKEQSDAQAAAQARSAARAEAKSKAGSARDPSKLQSDDVNVEKGIKGLK